MFDDEKAIITAARRWYASAKKNRDPIRTHRLAIELSYAVVVFERGRKLKGLTPSARSGGNTP